MLKISFDELLDADKKMTEKIYGTYSEKYWDKDKL
jgi:hypothetical protein